MLIIALVSNRIRSHVGIRKGLPSFEDDSRSASTALPSVSSQVVSMGWFPGVSPKRPKWHLHRQSLGRMQVLQFTENRCNVSDK